MKKNRTNNKLPNIWKNLEIQSYEELTSTNDWIKRYLRRNIGDEILILANKQTDGRGRNNRSFYSQLDQGLYFSLGINVSKINPNDLPLYTIAAATAMIQAVQKELGLELKVKWVNDLFYHGKKVGGILSEAITDTKTTEISSVVIGIGLNLAGSFAEADEITQETAGTFYQNLPVGFNLDALVEEFLIQFGPYHENLKARYFIPIYEKHLLGVGREVYYMKKDKKHHGRIKGINKAGQLVVINKKDELEVLIANEIHFSSQQFAEE